MVDLLASQDLSVRPVRRAKDCELCPLEVRREAWSEVRYQHIPLFLLQCNVSERFVPRLDSGEEEVHDTRTGERIERPVEFLWSDRRPSEARDHCGEDRWIRRHLRDLSLLF